MSAPKPKRCKLCGALGHETMKIGLDGMEVTVCPEVPESMGWLVIGS